MLNINVYLTNSLISDELTLKDKNVVVIDVLRATTTMTIALANGAKEIIPADTATKAARIAKGAGSSLLCGERAGKIIEGFNLGNSPLEYTPAAVKDKSLIFSTTNGTGSIVKARHAKSCVLASFVNLSVVAEYINSLHEDVIIICSGKLSNFAIEDAVCAGLIIDKVMSTTVGEYMTNDPEIACLSLNNYFIGGIGSAKNAEIHKLLSECEHGKYLDSIGFKEDLEVCARLDSVGVLPVVKNGVIKLKEAFENETSQKSQMKKVNLSKKEQDISEE
jgi:2-phosphosulfolactate phosphatase